MYKFIYCEHEWGGTKAFHLEGLIFSKNFCNFFAETFTKIFVNTTGLKPSSKVTLAGYKQRNELPIYQPGSVSKLILVIWLRVSVPWAILEIRRDSGWFHQYTRKHLGD